MVQSTGVVIYRGAAYLAVDAQMDGGAFVQIEPVFRAALQVDAVAEALTRVLEAGHPRIPALSPADWKRRKDPMLAATGAKSWKKLAEHGASYGIVWEHDAVTVYTSILDEQGRFVTRPEPVCILPKDASVQAIADAILADARGRPEILD